MRALLVTFIRNVEWQTIQGAVIGLVAVLVLAGGLAIDARSEPRSDDE